MPYFNLNSLESPGFAPPVERLSPLYRCEAIRAAERHGVERPTPALEDKVWRLFCRSSPCSRQAPSSVLGIGVMAELMCIPELSRLSARRICEIAAKCATDLTWTRPELTVEIHGLSQENMAKAKTLVGWTLDFYMNHLFDKNYYKGVPRYRWPYSFPDPVSVLDRWVEESYGETATYGTPIPQRADVAVCSATQQIFL